MQFWFVFHQIILIENNSTQIYQTHNNNMLPSCHKTTECQTACAAVMPGDHQCVSYKEKPCDSFPKKTLNLRLHCSCLCHAHLDAVVKKSAIYNTCRDNLSQRGKENQVLLYLQRYMPLFSSFAFVPLSPLP